MVDPGTVNKLLFQLLFLGTCLAVIFVKLLPLSMVPPRFPPPDLLYCFVAAFVLRRPRMIHPAAIFAIFMLADILFLRPLGLWPALAVVGCEVLFRHARASPELLRSVEIVIVPLTFAAMMAANAFVYFIFGLEHPSFGRTSLIVIVTTLSYPFVMLTTEYILGVRRIRPNEM